MRNEKLIFAIIIKLKILNFFFFFSIFNLYLENDAKKMISPGFEPGTVCVLDRRDNRLHHEIKTSYAGLEPATS